jgi:hypothetical protein
MCHTHTLFEIYENQKIIEKINENGSRACKNCNLFIPDELKEFEVFGICLKLQKTVAREHLCPLIDFPN